MVNLLVGIFGERVEYNRRSYILVVHFVDTDRHMLGIGTARIHVAIVLGHQIDVMKTVAVVRVLIEGVYECGVHYYCFVEGSISPLLIGNNEIYFLKNPVTFILNFY